MGSGVERLEARELRSEGAFSAYGRAGVGHNFGRAVLPRPDDQIKNAITIKIPIATLTLPSNPGNGMMVPTNRSPLPS